MAAEAHKNQVRKYNRRPFITHPIRVAGRVATLPEATEDMVVAAWLHDVVEDCEITVEEVEDSFGEKVAELVVELTNFYTKTNYPQLNREERKKLEIERIEKISREAKIIKLVDRLDNLREMPIDNEFMKRYIKESKELLFACACSHASLEDELKDLLGELNGRLK